MSVEAPRAALLFGEFEADEVSGELLRAGVRVALQEQPFRVLMALLAAGGRVVTREELREDLWPRGLHVDFAHGLNTAVRRLREALGDTADTPRFIETLPRRGYRFIAPVERARKAPAASRRSVAVLPFRCFPDEPGSEVSGDGITEDIITELSRVAALGVVSRTSVMQYGRREVHIREVARALRADMVVEGSVRRAGGRVRIAVRLIDARTDERVWAETYDRDPADVHGIGKDIALQVALELVPAVPAGPAIPTEIEERSPYPGIVSFTEGDASLFFGRESEVTALWERIRARPLLAVIGPSGAGKTSFLRAGVIPARPECWGAIAATPGAAPFRGLVQALAPELASDRDVLRLLVDVDDPETTFQLVVRWRRKHREALLVVDQFEELFTLGSSEIRARFAALLARLATEAGVRVLLSLRDDFLMRCTEQRPLAAVFDALTPLRALTEDGLTSALVEPARTRGYRFEDEALVDEMVKGVNGERGALPLLAFAVSRLWERRDRERKLLTREAYVQTGGVAGALAQHAEAAMDRIGSTRQELVRDVFRNLVTAHGTRAAINREELLSAFSDRAAAENVLGQLVDARLLTSYEVEGKEGEPRHRLEVVHESLLTAWPRLARWQAQDEEGAVLRGQLRQAARLWDEKSRTADLLWTGTAYQEFELWRGRYPGALTALEEQFAKAMAAKARRKKRLARAFTAAAVIALAGVAVAIGFSRHEAVVAARRAEASKLLAIAQLRLKDDPTEALVFATASLDLSDTMEARLLALGALQEAPPAWEISGVIGNSKIPRFSPDGRHLAVAGHYTEVAVWSEDGGPPVRLPGHEPSPWDGNDAVWASPQLLVTGLRAVDSNTGAVSWKRAEGRPRATDRRVHVWSMPAGRKLRTIDFGAPSTWHVLAGRLFAETEVSPSSEALDLRSWRLPDGEPETLGRVDPSRFASFTTAFEPHGTGWLYAEGTTAHFVPLPVGSRAERLVGRYPSRVELWTLGLPLLLLHGETGENRRLSFREDGSPGMTTLPKPATAPPGAWPTTSDRWIGGDPTLDARLRLWDTTAVTGARPLELRRAGDWYESVYALDPAARLVVAPTHGKSRLTFWPLPARLPSVVEGHKRFWGKGIVAFGPDGKWLAGKWNDGRIRLWPLPGSGATEARLLDERAVAAWNSIAFDPAGRYLFAVGVGDNAWLLPLDGTPGRKLDSYSDEANLGQAAVSPTGRRVATAFVFGAGAKTLRVWDVETGNVRLFDLPVPRAPAGAPRAAQTGAEGGVSTLAFLDDSTLFTGGDGGIRRWNLDTGRHELVRSVAFGASCRIALSSDRREILYCDMGRGATFCGVIDLATGSTRPLTDSAASPSTLPENRLSRFATQGPVVAMTGTDGAVRVGPLAGGPFHLLLGHVGGAASPAISPDLEWVASTGDDGTLRLWPMPDISRPPLHTLPHDELLAKLRSLTNLRAVRDAAAQTGWKIELGPFPGWKNLPAWEPYPMASGGR